ncbi:MAG: hypothetical protein HZA67_10705 [Rhodospirillales bacterium]|nr:hypothetical protein [Rhodospirillales bacterium]
MTRTIISTEENNELQRLYSEYVIAVRNAGAILAAQGMKSPEFLAADKVVGGIWRRIREILGD